MADLPWSIKCDEEYFNKQPVLHKKRNKLSPNCRIPHSANYKVLIEIKEVHIQISRHCVLEYSYLTFNTWINSHTFFLLLKNYTARFIQGQGISENIWYKFCNMNFILVSCLLYMHVKHTYWADLPNSCTYWKFYDYLQHKALYKQYCDDF